MNEYGKPVSHDKGIDRDKKFSLWRRKYLPRESYATDIDWLEWRKGVPVAVIEMKRLIGTLQTPEDALKFFCENTNGFQLEVYCKIAFCLTIPAYFIAVADQYPDAEDYLMATFIVYKINVPENWVKVGHYLQGITTKKCGDFTKEQFIKFMSGL